MQGTWPKLAVKVAIWIAAEITLTLMGLDDLADYSEYVFHNRDRSMVQAIEMTLVVPT